MKSKEENKLYNATYRVRTLGCNVNVEKKIIEVESQEIDYWQECGSKKSVVNGIHKSVLFLTENYDFQLRVVNGL